MYVNLFIYNDTQGDINYISELKFINIYMNRRFWNNRFLYAYMDGYYWPVQ